MTEAPTFKSLPLFPPEVDPTHRIPTLSLFSGAGGLDIGFHLAGFDIVASVEIEPAYCETLLANVGNGRLFGPNLEVFCEDVREFDPGPFLNSNIECIIGGPPCQTFSAAGRRSGGVLGTDDERGQLFLRYCEIIEAIMPKVFVFENVYGLPGANGGGPWREILTAFSGVGYSLRAEVLDSADYGVPQHRERLFMVGFRQGEFEFPMPTHGPDSDDGPAFVSAKSSIYDLQNPAEPYHDNLGGMYGHLLPQIPNGLNYSFFTKEMGHPEPVFAWRSKFHDLLYKVDPEAPVRTIKAQPGKFTGPFHWKNRHFSEAELKRLQTFPDEYCLVGSYNKIVEQIGNSVPPRLAEVLAVSVRQQLLDNVSVLTYARRPPGFRSTFRQRQRDRTRHYKKVAFAEVQRRFGTSVPSLAEPWKQNEIYYLRVVDRFDRRKLTVLPKNPEPWERFYSVDAQLRNDLVDLSMQRELVSDAFVRMHLNIAGLEKYLGHIDKLTARATIVESADLFSLWAVIEDALVTRSRFFTLIDIYGHYANRGDTVKIKTEFETYNAWDIASAIQHFGNSENCGVFLRDDELSHTLGITVDELHPMIAGMRALRFDVRTSRTHATISPGCVICTYPFPLLSEKAHLERRVKESEALYEVAIK